MENKNKEITQSSFFEYLLKVDNSVLEYLKSHQVATYFKPQDISTAVWSYILRPAKRLRPAVLLLAAGAVGGDRKHALPAAAGIEVFHTWTLVHDDLIDNDLLRRGLPSAHELGSELGKSNLGLSEILAKEYGRNLAILTGDTQHGWATTLFLEMAISGVVSPQVVLKIVYQLQSYVLAKLVYGETLDVQYSYQTTFESRNLTDEQIVEMLWLKTGVLYEFSGWAGAMIGKNSNNSDDPEIQAMKNFTSLCGTAFQLQDDIIGVVGDESQTGKPFGSDIREGKKTIIVLEALRNAKPTEYDFLTKILGNRDSSIEDIKKVASLLRSLNGIKRTEDLAKQYIEKALPHLDIITDSECKRLLLFWAKYMIERTF